MSVIILTKTLNVWYGQFLAVKSASVEISERSITALIGASGSGKSSFLRCLNRMIDVIPKAHTDGQVLYRGNNILDAATDVIALRRSIGMVFQNPTPFPKSIYDNIAYGLEIQGLKKRRTRSMRLFRSSAIDPNMLEASLDPIDRRVVQSLKEAALWDEVKDRLHQSAFGLSGGQQQRLCIARSIAVRPDVLLLDEPCSELDPISTRKIEDLLLDLKKRYTIVIVTHNMHQARRVSDAVGFFHLGELVEFGPVSQIFVEPQQQLTRDYVAGAFG
ncbi:MAG: phosphate ABC transporter ATP-binding protein [Deltaproteobacteria bacterium RIFCSPLOWO2_02_FULL_46_8]|nr:MAG: phosphate ABC transporter ATP-binding protein [Deltaproteobacteria bacterium RIFCSPLOWO2_02_FULL_46_8]